jgi:hypothetical protein
MGKLGHEFDHTEQFLLMDCNMVVDPIALGISVCKTGGAGPLPRNRDFTIGRPVGANGEGLGGGDESNCGEEERGGELSMAGQSTSEESPPSLHGCQQTTAIVTSLFLGVESLPLR